MPILKLPKMNDDEVKQAIQASNICRIAFIDKTYPYISPFQYAYLNNTIYFHFTDYGKKKQILKSNNNVCVSIEHFEEDLSTFYFISMQGKLALVENEQEKFQVLEQIVQMARKAYSQNFLSAHGYEKEDGWEVLTKKNQILYKFIQMRKPIGLKSP